jgi:GDP-mannose transporter
LPQPRAQVQVQVQAQPQTPMSAGQREQVEASAAGILTPLAVLACVSYAVSSTLITLLNKIVFSHSRFHYPWTTLAVQNTLSVSLIALGNLLGLTPAGRYTPKLARDMSIPIVCFVAFIFTNAQSMRYINIPVLTVWKSLGPMFVTIFERFYFGDAFQSRVYLAMALITLSAFVTAINDLEYSVVGYLWAAANVFANVAYLASLRIYLRSPHISALDKTFHSNLLSLIPICTMVYLSDETQHVTRDFQTTSFLFKAIFVLSGFITTAVCATAFWTISLTNGSTLSFIGGLNKIPMILISLLMFDTEMTLAGWFGVALGVLAGMVFMRAKQVTAMSYRLAPSSSGGVKAKDPSATSSSHRQTNSNQHQRTGSAVRSASAVSSGGAIGLNSASTTLDLSPDGGKGHSLPSPSTTPPLKRSASYVATVIALARRNIGFTNSQCTTGNPDLY